MPELLWVLLTAFLATVVSAVRSGITTPSSEMIANVGCPPRIDTG